jgi:hypothetical protein
MSNPRTISQRGDGQATGMAGEFFVMEQLFRLGHTPALTLGHTKMIDILVKTQAGTYSVSVKAVRGGGKWGVGNFDYNNEDKLIFAFLLYKNFEKVEERPEVYIVPAPIVEREKRPWFAQHAIYSSHRTLRMKDPISLQRCLGSFTTCGRDLEEVTDG